MIEEKGSIWKLAHPVKDAVCVPVNVGWTKDGRNVMGRGIAQQAAYRHPEVPIWYGDVCMKGKGHPPVVAQRFKSPKYQARTLIFVPTKALNVEKPFLSWQGKSEVWIIERSLMELNELAPPNPNGKIYVPLVGTGFGGLKRSEVRPIMDKLLTKPYFIRVRWHK